MMKENIFLLISIFYLLIVFYLLDFWNTDTAVSSSNSETHARNRYSVADEIQKEFQER